MSATLEEFLHEHHQVLVARLLPIIREIADTRARNRDELEGMCLTKPCSTVGLY